ncbi:hypothetical protein MH928_07500 [Flavobacterium sp. WW92]|uniref:restriction endonuclease n=1 Tax=unclassified Flavobacterium TaxID=196869 RepID=UPI0022243199|nr:MULTISPECIES: hypothetical protein [unclassified Flavobacterium]WDO14532.1 hypothetical protein MH928_07500 [Flavobacterium sp. WW92]
MMKKAISKPENWQDFETLCKKLWGEIWGIPSVIKKNGRLGQNQFGVDIYGVPKGETNYWGIQCKGKDEYSNAKLSQNEIENEILKATNFRPSLAVYIIATTANKDSKIEEFIRIKNFENQSKNLFEIHLFCWEDIVDLLEENQDILNFYLKGTHKTKFDFKVSFNDFQDDLILNPIFERQTTKSVLVERLPGDFFQSKLEASLKPFLINSPFYSNSINKSWCNFEINMENNGLAVIEDWYFIIKFKRGIRKIYESSLLISNLSLTTFIDNKNKSITYRPSNDKPLIQKDNRYFEVSVLPNRKTFKVTACWELRARDFNREGTIEIDIKPTYIDVEKIDEVTKNDFLYPDKVRIRDYIVDKNQTRFNNS